MRQQDKDYKGRDDRRVNPQVGRLEESITLLIKATCFTFAVLVSTVALIAFVMFMLSFGVPYHG